MPFRPIGYLSWKAKLTENAPCPCGCERTIDFSTARPGQVYFSEALAGQHAVDVIYHGSPGIRAADVTDSTELAETASEKEFLDERGIHSRLSCRDSKPNLNRRPVTVKERMKYSVVAKKTVRLVVTRPTRKRAHGRVIGVHGRRFQCHRTAQFEV
jgi:hypothetical protein